MVNWGGEKPILPNQLTRTFKTLGRVTILAADAAASDNHVNTHYVYLNNFNDPMATQLSFHNFGVATIDSNRHNVEHANLISYGFKRVQVRKCVVTFRVDVHSTGGEDWVFAWRFLPGLIGTPTVPHDTPADNEYDSAAKALVLWRMIRENPGWDFRFFSGTQSGGSPYPTAGTIKVVVPNVFELGKKLNRGYVTSADPSARGLTEIQDYEHELVDAAHGTDFPLASVHLMYYMFKVHGAVPVNNDAEIEVEIMQQIRAYRDAVDTLTAIPDTHA